VSCSRAFKWFIVLLLPLTLGWKVVVSSYLRSSQSSEPSEKVIEHKIAEFIVRNHFDVVRSERVVFGLQVLEATAGACRMRLAISSSRGWHRDLIRNFTTPEDRTFVVFGGKIYREQPMWLTVSDFLWSRFVGELGLKAYPAPVINVIASPICDAERLPWNDLG
jgi:hypothetical protein